MELARTLKTLWIRRRLVALGAVIAAIAALLSVYSIGLFPPSMSSRTNVFATASTQLLVDTPDSAFADLANDLTPLETRASVFARFLASPAALVLIAREADVPLDSIEAQGPYDINLPTIQQEPTAGQRSSQIIGEGAIYRLRFENNPVLPIVSVFAQAPSKAEAVALADAAPRALRVYINGIQAEQNTPGDRRVVIRKLGDATGGVVNEGANLQIALLVFIVVLGGWCMLLIPAQTLARGWREANVYGGEPNGGPAAGPHEYEPRGGFGRPGEHERVR
jgi:hypothetical protein